jgi:hypothetical protein
MHARCSGLGATGGVSIYTLQRLARLLDHRKGIIADVESPMREDERSSAVNVKWLQTLMLDTVLGKITDDDDALLVVADGMFRRAHTRQAFSQELTEDATMPRVKQASKQKRTTKAAALQADRTGSRAVRHVSEGPCGLMHRNTSGGPSSARGWSASSSKANVSNGRYVLVRVRSIKSSSL